MDHRRFYFNGHGNNGQPPPPNPQPATALEEKQALLAHLIRLVARRMSYGLFVYGTGGLGKSKVIAETLTTEGICPVLVNSHITPLALYRTLWVNRDDQVLCVEDCDSIYRSLPILGLLRSALWGQGDRIVTYTSPHLDGLPNQFVFESRIIFAANTLPRRNEGFRAVLSRVDIFELTATNEEILEQMRTLAARGYGTLAPATCLEVVEFIAQAGGTRQLSMRLYEPSLCKVVYARQAGVDWHDLVRCQLDQMGASENLPRPVNSRAHDLQVMAQAIAAHPHSVQAQQEFWCRATGKSRATFFRLKSVYEQGNRP